MRIVFTSHAGMLIETGGRRILCDPWFQSKVFNNGWALVSQPWVPDYATVDYIWISHEHPDHLNFPTLKAIPGDQRARIKVLHQRHASPRVASAIQKLGFGQVIELPLYRWTRPEPGVEVMCGSVGTMDSFFALRDGPDTLLNLNDCVLNRDQLKYLGRKVGRPTILFTQFSFANWVGNDADEIRGASRKIEQLRQQVEILEPRFTVPHASFVYFCNEENCRMNAWMNTPEKIASLGIEGVNFMYPGDVWDSEDGGFDSEAAVLRYMQDYATMRIDPTPPARSLAEIVEAANMQLAAIKSKAPRLAMRGLEPFEIHISDLDEVIHVDPHAGRCSVVTADDAAKREARHVMCSQVAWFTFAFSFGGSTTAISGMLLDRDHGRKGDNRFFWVQNLVSTEAAMVGGRAQTARTARFWWDKKGEVLRRFTGQLRGQMMYE